MQVYKMKKLRVIILVVAVQANLFAQGPGNVTGSLRWWLKGNAGVYTDNGTTSATDGQAVQQWNDQSSIANHARQTDNARKPTYRTGIINGNPVLRFSTVHFIDGLALPGIGPTESFYIFLVFKQNSWVNGGNDANGTFIIDRPTPTPNLATFKMVSTNKYFYQRREDGGGNLGGPTSVTSANNTFFVIADYFRNYTPREEGIHLNGALNVLNTGAPGGNITGPIIRIGNHASNVNTGGLNGDFAEMIVYNTVLSATDRRKVESYLAIKYGVTLDPAINYLKSDGATIYPVTSAHSSYASDVAGIGQDDNSALNQRDSKSQNLNSVVRVYNPSGLGNNEYLVWGSNNGSLTTPNSTDVGGSILRRLSRVWRVAETGDVGSVTMEFDLSAVPGAKVQADLRLLIDRDDDGFFDNDIAPQTGTLVGNVFTVTAVDMANLDYFTIGTTNTSTTPLPIELTDFDVTYESPAVVATWKTATELNNEYFTLERAGEDLSFDEIARQPGAGTSKEPRSYSAVDPNPYEGKSYYRLKQTDYDGTFTYSSPKFILIEGKGNEITVHPNPNQGKVLHFKLGTSLFNLQEVEVLNQHGSIVETKFISEDNLREYSIELQQKLSQGLYMLRVKYNGKEEYLKVIID